MSTTVSSLCVPSKYRRQSTDVLDDMLTLPPIRSLGDSSSPLPSSSPIVPRLPGLSSMAPLSSSKRSPLRKTHARIQSSPALGFEIGLYDVDDDNGGSSVWTPYRHNGDPAAGKVARTRWHSADTDIPLPSFRASFSPSDDSEPPLTSDFDMSEFSEDMDVDVVDLSGDEDFRQPSYSHHLRRGQDAEFPQIDAIDYSHDPKSSSHSVSAEHGRLANLTAHDPSALSIADILLQFHDQPRHARSDSIEPPRRDPSPLPEHSSVASEDSPSEVSHVEAYDAPPSPLSPLPPSSPALSLLSMGLDLAAEEDVNDAADVEVVAATTSVVPSDSIPSGSSESSRPSKVMSVEMLLLPRHTTPEPQPAKVEEVELAPLLKQPLANKQNQLPHTATTSTAVSLDLDIETSDLSALSSRPSTPVSRRDANSLKEIAKGKRVGTAVQVTKTVRVKKPAGKSDVKVEAIEDMGEKTALPKRKDGSASGSGQEQRRSTGAEDGPKRKKIRTVVDAREDSGPKKKQRGKEEAKGSADAASSKVPKNKRKKESEPPSTCLEPVSLEAEGDSVLKQQSPPVRQPSPSPEASLSTTTPGVQAATSDENDGMSNTEMVGLLIETFAMSRASSMPPSSLYKSAVQCRPALKSQRSKDEWIAVIETVLAEGRERCGVFERVESSYKGNSDRPLEAQWFYVPERDEDQERAELIRSMMPRLEKRKETRKYKQYYWQPLDKMSKWDPEDEM